MADRIGRFEILSEIARSQSACIYKALDPESGQQVALKTVKLDVTSPDAAALLASVLQEADTTKPLNSPNIAALYGAGDIEGQFCAAMEYVQGKSISSILGKHEGFSVWDLQDIARQACQAFDHAHARQVVHYTLEPGKIMVSWDGTVKVLAFGVSSITAGVSRATGTAPEALRYMSPEQVRGEPLDARSNLFSLGAILYEMVTGRKAFGGDDAELLRQEITVGMPVAPSQIIPKVHPGLSALIMKALAKAPAHRYQSGQDLISDLEQCKENAPKASARKNPTAPPAPEAHAKAAEEHAPLARKAAAAAGWGGSHSASSGSTATTSPDDAAAAWAPERKTEAPPASGNGKRSFSDVTSLPPLAESFVPAAAGRATEPEVEEPLPAEAAPNTVFSGAIEAEKPKAPPAELAKRAVTEIRKTPPKLFLISIAAAAAVIILVVAGIYSHVHSENAEENAPAAQATIAAPARESAQTQAPAPHITPEETETTPSVGTSGKPSVIVVSPKSAKKKSGKVFTPPTPVVVPGQLTINSTPEGAQVLVDGHHDPAWLTPLNVTGLAPGQHLVSVTKQGYSQQARTIDVASGSKSFLVIQLAQLGATAFVSSVPPGAQLYIDGHDTGKTTPVELPVEKPGSHTFLVRKQGFLDETSTANLQPGQAFQFAPVLQALGVTDDIKIGGGRFKKIFGGGDTSGMGSVTVKTQPKGAQIAINRRVLDKASPVEFFLNPGTYILDVTLSGYGNVHRVINVERGGKLAVDETLEKQ